MSLSRGEEREREVVVKKTVEGAMSVMFLRVCFSSIKTRVMLSYCSSSFQLSTDECNDMSDVASVEKAAAYRETHR